MLIDIDEIIKIEFNGNEYFYALLTSKQLIYLINPKEVNIILEKNKPISQEFTIFKITTILKRWKIEKDSILTAPMADILLCAKILIVDFLKLYPLLDDYLYRINININKKWILISKNDFFSYVFSIIYEKWNGNNRNSVTDFDSEIKLKFEIICKDLNRDYKFKDLKKWIFSTKKIILKIVGEEFHLDSERIKHLQIGQKINLLADTNNAYDTNAIAVFLEDGEQIGFLRRPVAEVLHKRFVNSDINAKIVFVNPDNEKNNRILIEVNF